MIHLTRLNNQLLVVNADLIKFIENAPDTVITLITGEKLVVRESVDQVLQRIAEFQDRFYRRVAPTVVFDTGEHRESAGNEPARRATGAPGEDGPTSGKSGHS